MFRENSRELGVKNGMLGTVERTHGVGEATEGHLVVRLDSAAGPGRGRAVAVSMADYAAVDHGYATTIHKSQGATVDRAYVLASGSMDRHMTYVAMTRHRDGVALYADRSEFSDMGAVSARLSRSQAKETTLDYDRAGYAQRRGLDRNRPESEIVVPQAMRQAEHPVPERRTPEPLRDHSHGSANRRNLGSLRPAQEQGLAPSRADEAVPAQAVASGRAGFRDRYEAHKRSQALAAARDEQAHGLVREWGRLTDAYNKALPRLEADPAFGAARAQLLGFGATLQAHPAAAQALRERGTAFGILKGSPLARVLADQQPARAITGLMNGVETTMRDHLKQQAEREAALQLERSLSRGRGHGMSR